MSHYEPDSLAETGDMGDAHWSLMALSISSRQPRLLIFFTIRFRYVVEVGDGCVSNAFERLEVSRRSEWVYGGGVWDGPDVLRGGGRVTFPSGESTIATSEDSARKALRDVYHLVDAGTSKFKGLITRLTSGHADPRGGAQIGSCQRSRRERGEFYVDLGDPYRISRRTWSVLPHATPINPIHPRFQTLPAWWRRSAMNRLTDQHWHDTRPPGPEDDADRDGRNADVRAAGPMPLDRRRSGIAQPCWLIRYFGRPDRAAGVVAAPLQALRWPATRPRLALLVKRAAMLVDGPTPGARVGQGRPILQRLDVDPIAGARSGRARW